jgi:hypothetical protein
MARLDISTIGGGAPHEHFHRTRATASLIAALAGGLALFGLSIAIVAGIAPADSALLWVGVAACAVVWLTGMWWRWDSPDAREPHHERERRGY